MKKKMILLMMLVFALTLAGCGSSEKSGTTSEAEESVDASESGEVVYDGPSELPEDGIMITVNTDGMGQITSAEEGNPIAFSDEYPIQSSQVTVTPSTNLVLAAQADEGWKFVKWNLNGEEYSTDEQITITVTEPGEYTAVFEVE